MSKLSFRARALDSNKALPVYHAKDIPDLSDYSSVNRVVPQMPTGMEKEEETEHHLQRAITAQQIYGEAQRLIIPTPEAIFDDSDYQRLKQPLVSMPKQYIHVQAFTLEDELPDYDMDSKDEQWINDLNSNLKEVISPISYLQFEKMIDALDKGCGNNPEALTLAEAKLLLKQDDCVVKPFYEFWKSKTKKKEIPPAPPTIKSDKKENSIHDPYIAFRRRIEKMQTRKNRKNDEVSYEKMLKLRRDLHRACMILQMVKKRETQKKALLETTVGIFEKRYRSDDFAGDLLRQCYELLKRRQMSMDFRHQPLLPQPMSQATSSIHHDRKEDGLPRKHENTEEIKKRVRLLRRQPSEVTGDKPETGFMQVPDLPLEPSDDPDGPDGQYTFKRKRGVRYHAPRYDSLGSWPFVHPVEGGTGDTRYRYCCTSISRPRKCIGFSRRRVGRGGRLLFDRAWTPFDECPDDFDKSRSAFQSSLPNGFISDSQTDLRVPPWPHFKPAAEFSDNGDESSSGTNNWKFSNSCIKRDSTDSPRTFTKPRLHRSFSTQPTSKFRVNPYPTNGVYGNNQTILSSFTSSFMRMNDPPGVLRKTNYSYVYNGPNALNPRTLSQSISSSQASQLQYRTPSTAPASAVYQLNFPILVSSSSSQSSSTTKSHSPGTMKSPQSSVSKSLVSKNTNMLSPSNNVTLKRTSSVESGTIGSVGSLGGAYRNKFLVNKPNTTSHPMASPSSGHLTLTSTTTTPSKAINRTFETLPAFNTFRRPSSELNASSSAEVK